MYSLGITKYDVEEIKRKAEEIDFFVVTEKFNESMVLLRDRLCCKMSDVVYRRQNTRRSTSERDEVLPDDIRAAILDFNAGDVVLYGIGMERLECEMRGHTHLKESLGKLKHEMLKYEEKCGQGEGEGGCQPLHVGQVGVFVEKVRNEQRKKLFKKLQERARNLVKD